ncbi:MAG: tRNA uracil 4-sulfurtransferase ThiI [Mycoplasmoidaceae bacterium]
MKNMVLIKYGDLYLKGKNKKDFISSLSRNIRIALSDFEIKIKIEFDKCFIEFENINYKDEIINILKYIPGISFIIPCKIIERDFQLLKENILNDLYEKGTFKIEVNRKDKNYDLDSYSLKKLIGAWILKNREDYLVDVHNPDFTINIEVNKNNFIYYTNKIIGISGLPIGLNGRALVLLSGGIDSPVAGYLLQRKGILVDYITFVTPPHTTEKSLDKVKSLVKKITLNNKINNSSLYIINLTNIMSEINHIKLESYKIILMRRVFLKIASKVSKIINSDFIATGDSLGQVASQTIESINCTSSAINEPIVLRPLITFSKNEIIDIAKFIGTYEISILPYEDSCSMFVPKNPITKPKIEKTIELEQELEYLDALIEVAIKEMIRT